MRRRIGESMDDSMRLEMVVDFAKTLGWRVAQGYQPLEDLV